MLDQRWRTIHQPASGPGESWAHTLNERRALPTAYLRALFAGRLSCGWLASASDNLACFIMAFAWLSEPPRFRPYERAVGGHSARLSGPTNSGRRRTQASVVEMVRQKPLKSKAVAVATPAFGAQRNRTRPSAKPKSRLPSCLKTLMKIVSLELSLRPSSL